MDRRGKGVEGSKSTGRRETKWVSLTNSLRQTVRIRQNPDELRASSDSRILSHSHQNKGAGLLQEGQMQIKQASLPTPKEHLFEMQSSRKIRLYLPVSWEGQRLVPAVTLLQIASLPPVSKNRINLAIWSWRHEYNAVCPLSYIKEWDFFPSV